MWNVLLNQKSIIWHLSDRCRHLPDGFTYGMPGQGCRAYWVCVNGHSVGACCPVGSYYIEGLGCMSGIPCNEPCPRLS